VVLKEGAAIDLAGMVTFLKAQKLSMHKVPEQLEVLESLPRNPSGKVLKKDLRVQFGGKA